ncbi:hypothetical protein [Streptomyces sp. NPDC056921]|uniref:hypothetical protein n=1 Tax=Streptomyces sp. NPDC056921 TaxID=3345966 RepID=UPI00362C784A
MTSRPGGALHVPGMGIHGLLAPAGRPEGAAEPVQGHGFIGPPHRHAGMPEPVERLGFTPPVTDLTAEVEACGVHPAQAALRAYLAAATAGHDAAGAWAPSRVVPRR